ncbi:dihydroxyacetone kinase family protein [Paracoccus sediminis]|uniref:Dihydroxyacetone kinase family protein n=1 Tax=Paracoccus sediminis TaxID=1214787 RepID=A0A238WL33_9RHOB|nr:dihydroxyacetone kinase family protein [Paracoccus sediminis]TBN50514.1 dihydroxyacetone kinase family protein [Paracoccus sediminis]SNR47128.1 homodimeric dihydroxyacetone kinase [Paracoccus sediminis]
MTKVFDAPDRFAETALQGFCAANADRVRAVPHGAVRAAPGPRGKVALLVGGGSGHYPAFLGYVGTGFADAAVAGDVFASPSTAWIHGVARAANRGGGVILGFGNYAGDVLNFGSAAERLRTEGIDARILAVTDDVASAKPDERAKRRGVAGDLPVFKIVGAAAEAGLDLDAVMAVAAKANGATVSFGVAFDGCTLPGQGTPLFTVDAGRVGMGLGIHGEPGISTQAMMSAVELARTLLDPLLAERPAGHGGRVAVVLNGLGRTKYEELFVLWHHLTGMLADAGLTPVNPEVGEFVTSLDMAGCSLTLTWLDDELEGHWCAPADAPAFRRGTVARPVADDAVETAAEAVSEIAQGSPESQDAGRCVAMLIGHVARALADAEEELGRIDAQAGDGDHGQGMARGSAAAAAAADQAVAAGAGAGTVLSLAGDAWADRAGGTSGALWGVALRAWGQALGDADRPSGETVAQGAQAAQDAIVRLGGARVGDKTLVDSLVPFVQVLNERVGAGETLGIAWAAAAARSTEAADATAGLTPRLGRARPLAERSLGHPDAGAISLALCARVVGANLPD